MNTTRLASRKLWVAIGGSTLITILTFIFISMGVSEELTTQVLGWLGKVIIGYLGGQGIVDVAKAIQTGKDLSGFEEVTELREEDTTRGSTQH